MVSLFFFDPWTRSYFYAVEMCAIYKYGNDDVLRMNAFPLSLSYSMPFVSI